MNEPQEEKMGVYVRKWMILKGGAWNVKKNYLG